MPTLAHGLYAAAAPLQVEQVGGKGVALQLLTIFCAGGLHPLLKVLRRGFCILAPLFLHVVIFKGGIVFFRLLHGVERKGDCLLAFMPLAVVNKTFAKLRTSISNDFGRYSVLRLTGKRDARRSAYTAELCITLDSSWCVGNQTSRCHQNSSLG